MASNAPWRRNANVAPIKNPILTTRPLGFPWTTDDPFLFCVHHDDAYPAGNEQLGPKASLAGRDLGQDFAGKDGWRMYHGLVVPGFPEHPHRGFETVTIVRKGMIDHSDSLGAAARFGAGDTQWLTAGAGIVHSEMFPLLNRDAPNPVELFQIWLNLAPEDKMAEPHFSMLWNQTIVKTRFVDEAQRATEINAFAGSFNGEAPPSPPPRSWAARPESNVAIWTIKMEAGATFTLPPAEKAGVNRTLYFFNGNQLTFNETILGPRVAARVHADVPIVIKNGDVEAELLMLQGRPIGKPVVQYGPFVMNTQREIEQAMHDYRRTRFGGWPWPAGGPVHGAEQGRFARHADGKVDKMDEA